MRLPLFIATRFLREGRMQTALIISGMAIGVSVMVFLSALIGGLQESLVRQTLGTQPHIVIKPLETQVRPMWKERLKGQFTVITATEQTAQRLQAIENWQAWARTLAKMPGIVAVSPVISGAGLVTRGNAYRAVLVQGIVAEDFDRVIHLSDKLIRGQYDVSGASLLIGSQLASDLGAQVGDKVRVSAGEESGGGLFTVGAIFDLGNRDANQRWVLMSLRGGQNLLNLGGGVSRLELRIEEIFNAAAQAKQIAQQTGLLAESWMETGAQLLAALQSQSQSSYLIQLFVVVAVAMGIASVLVVAVVQKSSEIGILRALGASRRAIGWVFLIEGALLGVIGSVLGCALGALLIVVFTQVVRGANGAPLFPIILSVRLLLNATAIATATGILSAALPARRAARLNPAEAIRHV